VLDGDLGQEQAASVATLHDHAIDAQPDGARIVDLDHVAQDRDLHPQGRQLGCLEWPEARIGARRQERGPSDRLGQPTRWLEGAHAATQLIALEQGDECCSALASDGMAARAPNERGQLGGGTKPSGNLERDTGNFN
jgi:hypothetical protein